MNAEDLRLDLYVIDLFHNKMIRVDANDIGIADKYQNLKLTSIPYAPIELTKDWFEKFQFEMNYQNQKFQIGNFIASKSPNGWKIYYQYGDKQIYLDIEIKYVHELQNVFRFLMKYELSELAA